MSWRVTGMWGRGFKWPLVDRVSGAPDLRFSADQLNFLLAREMDLATRICQDSNSLVHAVRDVVFVWPIY
jgi:hypothetical protein